jgi:hypothetical protein
MPRARAVEQALDFLGGLGQPEAVDARYPDVVRDLARETQAFVIWTMLDGSAAVSTYTLPPHALAIQHVIWYPEELPRTDARGLDLVAPGWEPTTGDPLTWHEDQSSARTFAVFPTPTADGARGLMALDSPEVGLPPTGNPVVFYAYVPEAEALPAWLDGVLALDLAAREAENLGEAQDLALSAALRQVSQMIRALVFRPPEGG